MTKTINKKPFAIIAAIAVFALVLSLVLVGCSTDKNAPPENDFAAEIHNTEHVKLTMSSVAVLAADNSVSKTLTATVLPETAENKKIDWTVEWDDTENTGNRYGLCNRNAHGRRQHDRHRYLLQAFYGNYHCNRNHARKRVFGNLRCIVYRYSHGYCFERLFIPRIGRI